MDNESFEKLLNSNKETEHLEFKEARNSYNFEKGIHSLCGYFVALANEKGGKMILGVSDKFPRKVVGTSAFNNVGKLKKSLFDKFNYKIEIEEFYYNDSRILIIYVPSRPIGRWLEFEGRALMRIGDSLVNMSSDQQRKIINEEYEDYSSKIIEGASLLDLSIDAINELRKLLRQSNRVDKDISLFNDKQLLIDLRLIKNTKITLAALVLLGKEGSLKKFLPNVEIRFGYRISEQEIRNQDSKIYSEGYLIFYDEIWEKIDSRNLSLHIPEGLRLLEKKAFNEETIREAINNAIIHRDYSQPGTILIIQTQDKIEITSPGGLLEGITIENMIDETETRNKLIADVLYKCGFVEQFGNGVNLMVANQLALGKSLPDYNKTTDHKVVLKIDGTIKDLEFARYVHRVAEKKEKQLNDKELLVLNKIKNNKKIESREIARGLRDLGLIEYLGGGKYILSKEYYKKMDKKGEYTRRKGLDKETNKELILSHLRRWGKGYMKEFLEALRYAVPKYTINNYLSELKEEGKIELVGNPRIVRGKNAAYWKLKN